MSYTVEVEVNFKSRAFDGYFGGGKTYRRAGLGIALLRAEGADYVCPRARCAAPLLAGGTGPVGPDRAGSGSRTFPGRNSLHAFAQRGAEHRQAFVGSQGGRDRCPGQATAGHEQRTEACRGLSGPEPRGVSELPEASQGGGFRRAGKAMGEGEGPTDPLVVLVDCCGLRPCSLGTRPTSPYIPRVATFEALLRTPMPIAAQLLGPTRSAGLPAAGNSLPRRTGPAGASRDVANRRRS